MTPVKLLVTAEDFDPGAEIALLSADQGASGAIATFIGLVRGAPDSVTAMTLEHYPGMTEKQIGRIIDEARSRWTLDRVGQVRR